tara:strand:+ start:201 stop:377 length:177 start_codon:yes stop_codon:yes gene_type:complete
VVQLDRLLELINLTVVPQLRRNDRQVSALMRFQILNLAVTAVLVIMVAFVIFRLAQVD